MAAILGMDRAALEKTCLDAAKNGIVAPANYNSPGQIVIAGDKKAVEKLWNWQGPRAAKSRASHGERTVPLLKVPNIEDQKNMQDTLGVLGL
jgi:malonyl CoA-acyl carrier protein transacylase